MSRGGTRPKNREQSRLFHCTNAPHSTGVRVKGLNIVFPRGLTAVRIGGVVAVIPCACHTVRGRHEETTTSKQSASRPQPGHGYDYRDTVNRSNSGITPGVASTRVRQNPATAHWPSSSVGAGFKSLFQKSPLKNRAVHGATIYDINPPVNT